MRVRAEASRESVRVALADALAQSAEGSGRLLLLVGEAGIGKTTTARTVVTSARRSGVAVRWSACWAGGATVAHAPWLMLLSGLGAPGRRAMDSLIGCDLNDRTSAEAARMSAYTAVVSALEEATVERPSLLVLDDLHWADEGTLRLLDVVAAHVPGMALLIVGTYRDTDIAARSGLTQLGGRADRLALHGLDQDRVASLLGEQLGKGTRPDLVAEVIGLTGGNPFLVVQMARLLAEDPGALRRAVLPAGARDLLAQRLSSLDAEDRTVLVAAAVLGSPFRAGDLAGLLARPPSDLSAALDRAARLRIVERAPGTGAWAFVHDLFRQAAVDGRGSAEIAGLHRAAATVLQRVDAEAAVIASHLLAGGEEAAVEGARWSVRAGDRALAAMAWEEAAEHHQRALSALRPHDRDDIRADALAGLGRARLLAADEQGAYEAFAQLATLARHRGSAELLARAALGFSADLSGFEVRLFDQRQIDMLEEAAALLADSGAEPPSGTASRSGPPSGPNQPSGPHSQLQPASGSGPGLRAMVLARLSVALSLCAPDARRLELAETAVALARAAADPLVLARCLAAHCDAIAGPADVDRREAEASEIIAIAEQQGDGPLELLGRRLRYVARLEQGDVAGVEEDTGAFARRASAIGNPLFSWYVPLWKAQLAVLAGQSQRAEQLIADAETLSRAAGSTNGPILTTVLRLGVATQRGDYGEAVRIVEAMRDLAPELALYVTAIGSFAWGYALAGRTAEAAEFLDRAVALGLEDQPLDAEWLSNVTNMVRAAALLGHPILTDALALLERHAQLVAFEGHGAGLYGSVARIVAIGCSSLGRHDDAVRHAERALVVNRRFGGMLTADALRTLAECRAARGDPPDATDVLHAQADAAYAAVGARHLTRAARVVAATPRTGASDNELRRDGDVWRITYAGTSTIVRHSKGMADLAVLLARPGDEVHVTELEGLPAATASSSGGEALDRRAIAAYRARLTELAAELADADAANDIGRAEIAQVEYDVLVEQLTNAVGIGGRSRAAGPEPVERVRKAVSARLRDAIRHIETVHGRLGRHLVNAVHTGTYCSYQPEDPTIWRTSSPGREKP